jgi:hypothetical protein
MLSRIAWETRPLRHRPPDRGFKMSLPMSVEGPDPEGAFFREDTMLAFMSHQGAVFPLWSPVALGSRVKLSIALPAKLGEGRNLTLVVKGTIVDVDSGEGDGAAPQVAIRLESRYVIQSDAA